MLEIDAIDAGYGGIQVLRALSLRIQAGEVVAILGRNGVGKTTLVKTLAGLLRATRGAIRLAGQDVTHHAAHACAALGIGYVPQGRGIFPRLTVRENLLVGLTANRFPAARISQAVELFPVLADRLDAKGGNLSGGQQQQLALARALVLQPKLLLLDEPSEGIQPSILDSIVDILLQARARTGLAILLVEQKLDFARALADRGYIMDDGRISHTLDKPELNDPQVVDQRLVAGTL